MSKLLISTGTNPNDGNGDTLLAGAGKVNSNFNEYLLTYNQINKGHKDSLDEIRKSFYQMAFCIEVRKTTKYFYLEREELGHFFDKFWRAQC